MLLQPNPTPTQTATTTPPQQSTRHPPLPTLTHPLTLYLTSPTPPFPTHSLQLFNLYKRFVQNTIMQLGEDWRIESGLLAQEIIAEKGLSSDQFCIFNQFMVGFLRERLGGEGNGSDGQNSKMVSEEQGQEEFLKYFYKGLQKSDHDGNTSSSTNDFANNLTFKTLSLGFYITASDIWTKTFKKYHQDAIQQKLNNVSLSQDKKLKYFATLDTVSEKWFVQTQAQIEALLGPHEERLSHGTQRGQQSLASSIKLGSVVVSVSQTVIKSSGDSSPSLTIRTFSLHPEFYPTLFLIWLSFSIKKSFNSSLFSTQCFIRYCDIIIGSRISQEDITVGASFHAIYKQFKLLCDNEWRGLMKDYMMALNDDREVLRVLVARVGDGVRGRLEREVEGKRERIGG